MGINRKRWVVVPFSATGSTTIVSVNSNEAIILRNFTLAVEGNTDIYLCNSDGKQLSVTFPINGLFVWEGQREYNIDVGPGKNLCINNSSAGASGEIMVSYDVMVLP